MIELENLQLISAFSGDLPPKKQIDWKNSSSVPHFGRNCKNELEEIQFIWGGGTEAGPAVAKCGRQENGDDDGEAASPMHKSRIPEGMRLAH
ncbi:hypothetical protein [Paenibacillus ferrarius]|uniref:hypothetical protein n=1 Tax=Paenibacillus ferrarius TaxID=1469647 RepID=UPI003D2A8560